MSVERCNALNVAVFELLKNKHVISLNHVLWPKICNLQCNLPYLPLPKIALVIYIILNLG